MGWQQDEYSVSEQASLRDVMICVVVNSGTLEREVVVNLNAVDTTAEGIVILELNVHDSDLYTRVIVCICRFRS